MLFNVLVKHQKLDRKEAFCFADKKRQKRENVLENLVKQLLAKNI